MKKYILLTIYMAFYTIGTTQVIGENNTITLGKPFSFDIDKKMDEEIIAKNRNGILEKTDILSIILAAQNNNLEIKLTAINQLGYTANAEGRILLEHFLLNDTILESRIASAKSLSILRSETSTSTLIQALSDSNRFVQIYSALALSYIGEKTECLKTFASFYKKSNETPFYSCHIGFLNIATPEVKPYLIEDLYNSDSFIAVDAAITLAQLGFKLESQATLQNFLSHSDRYIRMAALRGLAYIGDSQSLELVESKLNDPDELVRERSDVILKIYRGH